MFGIGGKCGGGGLSGRDMRRLIDEPWKVYMCPGNELSFARECCWINDEPVLIL